MSSLPSPIRSPLSAAVRGVYVKAGGVYGRVDAPAIPSGALLIDAFPVLIDGFYIVFS